MNYQKSGRLKSPNIFDYLTLHYKYAFITLSIYRHDAIDLLQKSR